MGGGGEDRLLQQIFPIAGEFLLADDLGAEGLAPAPARDHDRLAELDRAGAAELERRQAEPAQGLDQAEARLLVIGQDMAGGDPSVDIGQPDALRLGDQIADGQDETVGADNHAAAGTLRAQDRGREGIPGDHGLQGHDRPQGMVEVEIAGLGLRLPRERHFILRFGRHSFSFLSLPFSYGEGRTAMAWARRNRLVTSP
jgi:hypothetical protein